MVPCDRFPIPARSFRGKPSGPTWTSCTPAGVGGCASVQSATGAKHATSEPPPSRQGIHRTASGQGDRRAAIGDDVRPIAAPGAPDRGGRAASLPTAPTRDPASGGRNPEGLGVASPASIPGASFFGGGGRFARKRPLSPSDALGGAGRLKGRAPGPIEAHGWQSSAPSGQSVARQPCEHGHAIASRVTARDHSPAAATYPCPVAFTATTGRAPRHSPRLVRRHPDVTGGPPCARGPTRHALP